MPVDGGHPSITIPGGATRSLEAPTFTATFAGLPFGADCTATESDTGHANASTVSPAGSFSLASASTPVTITNRFTEGSVQVTKDFSGLGVPLYGNGPFEVTLDCTRDGDPITIPGGAARQLDSGNGFAVLYQHLPTGADCTATATKTGGATDSTGPVDVTIGDGTTENVGFTNTFDLGELTVTNVVTGNNAQPNLGWTFVVSLSCTLNIDGTPTDIAIPGGADRDILHLGTVDYTDLPIGAVCSLEETQTNHAETVTVTPVRAPNPLGRGFLAPRQLATLSIGATPVRFDVVNVYNIELAHTGTTPLPLGLTGLLLAFLGVAFYSAARLRRRS
jgi:hypothetical protein